MGWIKKELKGLMNLDAGETLCAIGVILFLWWLYAVIRILISMI